MCDKRTLGSQQEDPYAEIPLSSSMLPKVYRLALISSCKVCWLTFKIRGYWAVSVEWVSFSFALHGLSSMHINVLGLKYEGLYAKIPK